MLCLAPQPKEERTPQLVALLIEEPHVVIPKESRPLRGRAGLQGRETSVTRSEETHASSSTHEDEEDSEGEEKSSPKGKRAASEGAEEEARPKGPRRPQ